MGFNHVQNSWAVGRFWGVPQLSNMKVEEVAGI